MILWENDAEHQERFSPLDTVTLTQSYKHYSRSGHLWNPIAQQPFCNSSLSSSSESSSLSSCWEPSPSSASSRISPSAAHTLWRMHRDRTTSGANRAGISDAVRMMTAGRHAKDVFTDAPHLWHGVCCRMLRLALQKCYQIVGFVFQKRPICGMPQIPRLCICVFWQREFLPPTGWQ